ncbi:MAG: HAMP domain-containing histidine kinase [Rhizobiaceae bacterium]|nr:HAMP domain-containing histidine kinase [Rhizobiaceae bacterium]
MKRNGVELYSSPNLLGSDRRPDIDQSQLKLDGLSYQLLHISDAASSTVVTVGFASKNIALSMMEIVVGTVLCFVIFALMLWRWSLTAIRVSLKPLLQFASETRSRDSGNLKPLQIETLPLEVVHVGAALNQLMRKVETALEQERRFVGNAAHELRTPLSGIIAQIEALPETGFEKEHILAINRIRSAALRTSRLVSQMLNHERAKTIQNNRALSSKFRISEMVRELIEMRTQTAIESDVDLGVAFETYDDEIRCPRELLQMIIENLVDNAVKYCGRPGIVTLSIMRLETNQLIIAVDDNGPGLKPDEFWAATQRFERMGALQSEGYGLGLSLVVELCERLEIGIKPEMSDLGGLRVVLLFKDRIQQSCLG